MKVSKCVQCRSLTYPSHLVCRKCGATASEEAELGEGTLLTHTVVHVPPPGVDVPLRIGIVEFEGGIRALGRLVDQMDVGSRVVAEWTVVRRVKEREFEGFRFRKSGVP